jgi:hypothetical protein
MSTTSQDASYSCRVPWRAPLSFKVHFFHSLLHSHPPQRSEWSPFFQQCYGSKLNKNRRRNRICAEHNATFRQADGAQDAHHSCTHAETCGQKVVARATLVSAIRTVDMADHPQHRRMLKLLNRFQKLLVTDVAVLGEITDSMRRPMRNEDVHRHFRR